MIKSLDDEQFGFIIIGGGEPKPDFSHYRNVHDFGALYEKETKDELFTIADIYFQPGGCGLSVVEAMAYGKPIFTFRRSKDVLHSVEYGYIQDRYTGMIFDSIDECVEYVNKFEKLEIIKLGTNAREYVRDNLNIQNMVANAVEGIKMVEKSK